MGNLKWHISAFFAPINGGLGNEAGHPWELLCYVGIQSTPTSHSLTDVLM